MMRVLPDASGSWGVVGRRGVRRRILWVCVCLIFTTSLRYATGHSFIRRIGQDTVLTYAATPAKDWKTLRSDHFAVYYVRDGMAAARILKVSEELFVDIAKRFPLPLERPIEVRLAESPEDFKETVHAPIQDWAVGYAFPLERRIVIRDPSGFQRFEELDRVTRHEVAHICLGVLVGKHIHTIPLWFHEGFAMYLSEEWTAQHQFMLLIHSFFNRLYPLSTLSERFPTEAQEARLAYIQSFSAVRTLIGEHSLTQLKTLLQRLHEGEVFERAFAATFGYSLLMFDSEWEERATKGIAWFGLVGGGLTLLIILSPFFFIGYWRFRKARQAELRRWAEQESQPDPFFRRNE